MDVVLDDAGEAMGALREVQQVREQVAQRATCPPAWHVQFGLLMAAMVMGTAAPMPISMAVLACCMAAVVLMVQRSRRRMGFFVNGYRRGRTRRVALALLAFVEAMLGATLWLKIEHGLWWAPLLGGVVVFPVAVVGSRRWQAAFRRDLGVSAAAALA